MVPFSARMNDGRAVHTASEEDDYAVVCAVIAGDTNAFARLDKKYRRKLYGMIRVIIRNEDDAWDLVQDTLLKAYRALPRYKPEYSFEKWLFKIASNTCIDYLRRQRFAPDTLDIGDDEERPAMHHADPSIPTPDEVLFRQERCALVRAAIESLPQQYRQVIEMRHFEELEYTEIAARLGLPLGTIKAHLFRARQMLLKKLRQYHYPFEQ